MPVDELLENEIAVSLFFFFRIGDEADVNLAFEDAVDDELGTVFIDGRLDVRVFPLQLRDDAHEDLHGAGICGDLDFAVHGFGVGFDFIHEILELQEDDLGFFDEPASFLGRDRAPSGTMEDGDVEFFFQLFDRLAEGREGDMELICRCLQGAGFSDFDNVLQLFDRHNKPLFSYVLLNKR